MTCRRCALPGCNKPPWPSVGGITPHLACGNLHHQLLMASRFNPAGPQPYQVILSRNADGLCALLSCQKPPWLGHSWCSRTHYLEWLDDFTSSLHPYQICRLPGCTRHVFVDENTPPSQFCGWRHCQKFVILSALNQRRHQQDPLPSIEVHHPLPTSSVESKCGHLPSLGSLKKFALSAIPPPRNIRVLEDFYEKHPWEVLTEGHACWLIAPLKFTSKGKRQLTTEGHYHWKQSGRPATMSQYTVKYYKYKKRKGKKSEADPQHAESSYTMKEYTMEDVKSYSLIELVKEKPSSHGKLRKGQTKPQGAEVNNVCPQDTLTSNMCFWNDHMLVDISFEALEDFTYDDFTNDGPQICTV